jgi:hypothetical protein
MAADMARFGRPKPTPLIGRASPKMSATSANPLRGLIPAAATGRMKGIDMPNQAATAMDESPLGSATAKYKHDMPPFKFGG